MKFLAGLMIVVTLFGSFIGVKVVEMVEAADQLRPSVEQIIEESRE